MNNKRNFKMYLRNLTTARFRKVAFIKRLPKNACVLDVGCGNNGPTRFKGLRPDIKYVGVDVMDYNNTEEDIKNADEYHKTHPKQFAKNISSLGQRFDAVVSSHNLEHCNYPKETINAICGVIKPNGTLFLAFPSEKSISFPSRRGTLNFFDDSTHIYVPKWNDIIDSLSLNGFEIIVKKKQYKPLLHWVIGLLLEPISAITKRVMPGTWALWGFESIIWAKKRVNDV